MPYSVQIVKEKIVEDLSRLGAIHRGGEGGTLGSDHVKLGDILDYVDLAALPNLSQSRTSAPSSNITFLPVICVSNSVIRQTCQFHLKPALLNFSPFLLGREKDQR